MEEGFIVKQEAEKRKGGEKGEDGEVDVVGIKGESVFQDTKDLQLFAFHLLLLLTLELKPLPNQAEGLSINRNCLLILASAMPSKES